MRLAIYDFRIDLYLKRFCSFISFSFWHLRRNIWQVILSNFNSRRLWLLRVLIVFFFLTLYTHIKPVRPESMFVCSSCSASHRQNIKERRTFTWHINKLL